MTRRRNTSPPSAAAIQKAQLIREAMTVAVDLVKLGKLDEAEKVYLGVLQHHPDNPNALYNLGAVAHQKCKVEEAEGWLEKALRLTPDDSEVLGSLGVVKIELNKKSEGVVLLERSVKSTKPSAKSMGWHSMWLMETGRMKEAEETLMQALSLTPDDVTLLYGISVTRKFKLDDPILSSLLDVEKNFENLSIYEKIKVKFALGKAFYDCGEYEESFKRYHEGNKLKRGTIVYDTQWFTKYFDEIIRCATPETFKRLQGAGYQSAKPVFIIGMPRSGSTLSEQILSSHPQIFGGGEVPLFKKCLPVVKPKPGALDIFSSEEVRFHEDFASALTKEVIHNVGKEYVAKIDSLSPGYARFTDKMLFNFYWVPLIRLSLPNAKIVHCTRDPVDIGLSIYRQLFNQALYWSYDLREIGMFYKNYKRLMEYWNGMFPGDVYEANYETMVEDTETAARKLIAHCDLPWDDRCLSFYENKREVRTASIAQVRKPIYKDSAKGWKKVEKYLQPLIEELEKTS